MYIPFMGILSTKGTFYIHTLNKCTYLLWVSCQQKVHFVYILPTVVPFVDIFIEISFVRTVGNIFNSYFCYYE